MIYMTNGAYFYIPVTSMMHALVMAIPGLLVGYYVKPENRAMLFLMVIALLSGASGALGVIPGIGMYLTAILTNIGAVLSAATITVIVMVITERVTE